jgi:hypothetical protein
MRTCTALLALATILGNAVPARAQQSASSFFTGANPRNITFKPIDVGQASKAFNMSNMFPSPVKQKSFSFSSFMPSLSMPSWPPRISTPQVLQGTNPFQPNRPVGVNLFNPKQ